MAVIDGLIITPKGERECIKVADIQTIQLIRIQTEDHTAAGVILIVAGIALLWAFVGIILLAWGVGCLRTKGYIYRVEIRRMGEEIEVLETTSLAKAKRLVNDIRANIFGSNTIIT